jgi:hypothetical protein
LTGRRPGRRDCVSETPKRTPWRQQPHSYGNYRPHCRIIFRSAHVIAKVAASLR